MEVKLTVKIKFEKGKEITLNEDEARELYNQLKLKFDVPFTTWISYPYAYPLDTGTTRFPEVTYTTC